MSPECDSCAQTLLRDLEKMDNEMGRIKAQLDNATASTASQDRLKKLEKAVSDTKVTCMCSVAPPKASTHPGRRVLLMAICAMMTLVLCIFRIDCICTHTCTCQSVRVCLCKHSRFLLISNVRAFCPRVCVSAQVRDFTTGYQWSWF